MGSIERCFELGESLSFGELDQLRLVQLLSAGYDAVNIAGARKAHIPICQNGGANSVAVSEHAVLLILSVYRKIAAFHQNVAAGRWHTGIPRIVDVLELEGKTVGIVGLGNIGALAGKRAAVARAMACGESIVEINRLRKRLSAVKGGKLGRATRARLATLVLSD